MKKIFLEIKFNQSSEIDLLDKQAYVCDLFDCFKEIIQNPIIEEVNFHEI